jgi:hypothetical protein
VPPPKEEAGAPFRAEPVMTEGMKARRREMERRRREKALRQLEREEVLAARWERVRGLVLKLLFAVLAVLVYWRLQTRYPDNRWPLELVWGLMVIGVFGGLGWTLWYMNRGD